MYRTVGILLSLLIASSLGLVASQHRARQMYSALDAETARAALLQAEWSRLQIEAGTLGASSRVDRIARARLGMRPPAPDRSHLVFSD